MKPRLLVVGAGGHARVVLAIARRTGDWELAGVLDHTRPAAPEVIGGVPVIGAIEDAAKLFADGIRHIALAQGDNDKRAALHAYLAALGFVFPVLRHPSALVEDDAEIGEGSVICAGAIIGVEARIGRAVIINTGVIIDHETLVGDHAHVAPGCRIAGRVRIGAGVMLGLGSCVRDKIVVGARAIVGAGSVVVDDIPESVVAYGSPARVMRPRDP